MDTDPSRYFGGIDAAIERELKALESKHRDVEDRRGICWYVLQATILRVELFEDVVLPVPRMSRIAPSLLDQVESRRSRASAHSGISLPF